MGADKLCGDKSDGFVNEKMAIVSAVLVLGMIVVLSVVQYAIVSEVNEIVHGLRAASECRDTQQGSLSGIGSTVFGLSRGKGGEDESQGGGLVCDTMP